MVCCQSVCLPVCPFMFICLIVLTTACTFDMLVICPLICIVPAVSYFCLLFSHCSVFYLSVPRRVPIWPRSSVGRTTLICSGGRGFESHQQGSPKCGIVGGDKTEVEGEIGASREDPGACSPGKILKIYNT